MASVGIIAEYNPFHKGHLYHLNKVKEMFPGMPIILILIGNYTERGDISVINKWDKTRIALDYGINLVIELPFMFSVESADKYAKGAIELLKELKVNYLVFGSEQNDISLLKKITKIMETKQYNNKVKDYLKEGVSYPVAVSNSINDLTKVIIKNPNDLLGLSYVQQINKQHAKIEPITIKRTDDYHTSASTIRKLIKEKSNIEEYVPNDVIKYIKPKFIDDYYPLLKYKILTEIDDLNKYQLVEEGIENRIKKAIYKANTFEELINLVKTKRYTYNRIKRMFTNILCNLTKKEMKHHNEYIRVLGFDQVGRKYLKGLKTKLKVITKYATIDSSVFKKELIATSIYDPELVIREYQKPIIKE